MYLKLPRAISPWRYGRDASEGWPEHFRHPRLASPGKPPRGRNLSTTIDRILQVPLHVKMDECSIVGCVVL